jgi:hypothetical protein
MLKPLRYIAVGSVFAGVFVVAATITVVADQKGVFAAIADRYKSWETNSFQRATRGHM